MICEIAGWVPGGMQFGVLVLVLFELLVMARAHFIWIDGRVTACSLGAGAGAVLGCAGDSVLRCAGDSSAALLQDWR